MLGGIQSPTGTGLEDMIRFKASEYENVAKLCKNIVNKLEETILKLGG
jgi:hemerythrin superfamily protein